MGRLALATFLALTLQGWPAWGEESGVAREGKDWLQPSLFVDLSWQDVSAACPPLENVSPPQRICYGMLGSVDVTGCRWAAIADLFGLLQSYSAPVQPATPYGEEAGSAWAPDILGDFDPTVVDSGSEYVAVWIADSRGVWQS